MYVGCLMDKKISIKELLSIIKDNKKMIGIVVIISAVFVGGFRVYSDYREQRKAADIKTKSSLTYKKELEEYNKDNQLLTDTIQTLDNEKKSALKIIGENPIMKVDAFSSESTRVKITASNKTSYNAVENVLLTADSETIFGKSNSVLERYKWDIVQIPDMNSITINESGASGAVSEGLFVGNIYVYSIKGHKAKDVANNVIRFLESERSNRLQGVDFSVVSVTSGEAAKQALYNKQKIYRTNIENLKYESDKINEAIRALQVPSQNTATNTGYIKRSMKSGFIGGFFGAFVATMFAVYSYIRKQRINFANNIERDYGISALGVISKSVLPDVLVADIRQLDTENEGIGFVAINSDKSYLENIAEVLEKIASKSEYIGCIVDDVEAIDKIANFKNFVLITSDDGTDINENAKITINKLSRLDKKILGCINVE